MENEFPILQTDEAAARIALLKLLDQMLNAQTRQSGCLDAVKGRRIAALL